MEPLSLNKYAQIIIARWKIVAWFSGVTLILSILVSLFLYSPSYVSNCEVLIKQNNPTSFVAELVPDNQVSSYGMGPDKNPVLNQIEILSSIDMASLAADNVLKNKSGLTLPAAPDNALQNYLTKRLQRAVKFDNPLGTDMITIQLKWDNPMDAQKIAGIFLTTYYNYNADLNKKSITQTKAYIEKQLNDSSKKLDELRNKIKNYRKDNFTVDIELESASIVQQIQRVEDSLIDVNSNISNQEGRYNQSLKNLGVDMKKAIDSVALGGDNTLVRLQQTLQDSQQKYAGAMVKYPATTPEMKAMGANIKEIETQIAEHTLELIGKPQIKASARNNSLISDAVRSQMVADTVRSDVELSSLKTQKAEIEKILSELNQKMKQIPDKQKSLSVLLEDEKTLSMVVGSLNTKLVEAKIKESEIISNVSVVQNATYPESESFPTRLHIILMFMFAGLILGVTTVLAMYYLDDLCEGSEDVESQLKAPVLGIIPWLTNNAYNNFLTDYNPHSVVALIYQKIATSIKVKCYKKKINAIGIISAELEKRRSIVAASLANTFAKTKDRVVLIDTDFRDGSLTREFNTDFSKFPDITDLIMELSKNEEDNDLNFNEIVSKYIFQIPSQKNLYLIPNNNKVNNPFEILNSPIFPKLLQVLKTNFDFVIVDTPPMLAVADSIITSQHVDGLVVLCGIKTSRSSLKKIKKLCADNFVEILGAIARDTLTELEVPENMYIKQFSSKEV